MKKIPLLKSVPHFLTNTLAAGAIKTPSTTHSKNKSHSKNMNIPSILLLFTSLMLLTLSESDTGTDTDTKIYIIRTRSDLKPSAFPSLRHWYSSSLRSQPQPLRNAATDDSILHIYEHTFHGFSALLTPSQASSLRSEPFVLSVLPDRARILHTTRSPGFLGLHSSNSRLLVTSDYGDDVIVALLDSGIDPSHPSFGDTGLGPVPPRWNGTCSHGPRFPPNSCNRKLVGARFYASGFQAANRNSTATNVLSPYDSDGHGTHTASTVAGRPTRNASLFGHAAGTASGVAPCARLAVYKVCWTAGCFNSDILAAIDDAVADGADVISLSLGAGPVPYHLDPIAIAAFAATARGVVVSASAGNDGPGEMTVTNVAPWIATVGAGSIDRGFPADIILGDGTVVSGVSIHVGPTPTDTYYPLVHGGNVSTSRAGYHSSAPFCMPGSLDPDLTRGKVVLCERGAVPRAEKGLAVKEAGGAGMIVANQMIDGEGLVPDAHLLPAVAIGAAEGFAVHAYIASQNRPRIRFAFRGTQLGVKPAPIVASFSGRGPNAVSDYLLKPDLIAPGVGILAAWTDSTGPTGLPADARRTQFNILSGTSMACPHVSGIAALLKGAHPEWSPAAIKSAMMTSARVTDNRGEDILDESSGNSSTGWAAGSGQVDPEKAVSPGLVYDLTTDDYIDFLCSSNFTERDIRTITRQQANCSRNGKKAPWDLNYPSISVVVDRSAAGRVEVTVRRTVTNVGPGAVEYNVDVKNPAGSTVAVEPPKLVFRERGEKLGFVVKITAEPSGGESTGFGSTTEFGSITWRDGKHVVRSPVAVTRQQQY